MVFHLERDNQHLPMITSEACSAGPPRRSEHYPALH
jgi:hypothetical protein